jgi:hypothetical protein
LLGGFLGQSPLILRRQDFPGDSAGGLYNQPADLLLEFGKHTGVVLRRGLMCLEHDLFSGGNRLLSLLFQQDVSRSAGFLDELRRLSVSSRHYFLTLRLRSRQLRFHLVGISETLGDESTPIRQHSEDRPIGEPVKKKTDDAEADHLSYQMGPIYTERPGNLFDLPATLRLRHQDKCIHEPVLPYEEQGVEDDRLSKGNGQDGLDQNFGGRPGIAADYVRSSSADHAHG